MPFHSCPVVVWPVTGSGLPTSKVLPLRLVVLVKDASLGAVEALPVRRPERVDDNNDRQRDQVKQSPALGEADDGIVVHRYSSARADSRCAASVSRPRIWR